MDGGKRVIPQHEPNATRKEHYSEKATIRADQDTWKFSPSASGQHAAPAQRPRHIHIVGTGSVGKLVAHSLRGIPNPPPITLIFHRYKLAQSWMHSKRKITLQDEHDRVVRGGFNFEWAPEVRRQHSVALYPDAPDLYGLADEAGMKPHEIASFLEKERKKKGHEADEEVQPKQEDLRRLPYEAKDGSNPGLALVDDGPIHHLIVATKTIRTIPALLSLKHRISRETTICFLQNGMGVIDEVNAQIFPNEAERPTYMQGIITHGVNSPPEKVDADPFYVVHAGHGSITLGILPNQNPAEHGSSQHEITPSAHYLLRTLTRSPVLCAVGSTPIELLQQQLEKLAVNSVISPLTVLLDTRNGGILYNYPIARTMRLLLAETSLVLRSLPELRGIPTVSQRFSAERLEGLVENVARKTKDNVSSMLADARAGRESEIEYINGYIVRRGEELGIKCVVNYGIMQAVIGKVLMMQREVQNAVPVMADYNRE